MKMSLQPKNKLELQLTLDLPENCVDFNFRKTNHIFETIEKTFFPCDLLENRVGSSQKNLKGEISKRLYRF